jgi:hypothetical protein
LDNTMTDINELRTAIKSKREEYQAKADTARPAELRAITEAVKALGDKLTAAITEGAEPCEGCGAHPHGLVQEVAVKGQPVPYYEVGCLACSGKRAQGFTPGQAVEAWNAETYLKAKKKP